MKNKVQYISNVPDTKVQQIIDIFGKKKCKCGCDCADGKKDDHFLKTGQGVPTAETPGELGDFYRDELTGRVFECVEVKEETTEGGTVRIQVVQASDGPDSSYLNVDAWDEGDYGVLFAANNTYARALYVKKDGKLEELKFFNTTDENEIDPALDNEQIDYVVYATGGTFYVCFCAAEVTTTVYAWVELTAEKISDEEIENIINSFNL